MDDSLSASGQPTEDQLRLIAEAGFETVINLALRDDPRYSLPDEAGSVHALGMRYEHIPVPFAAPAKEHLDKFFDAMRAHRGERLWIHCAANLRVSAFLGLYRVIEQGWDEQSAFASMRELWTPDEPWRKFIAAQLRPGKEIRPDPTPPSKT